MEYQIERLDHLGIVAGVCREVGIAAWLDQQVGESRRDVSVGTAVVAMILNGLGFANRQLQASSQTVPNQVNKPTDRPTMRWIFQCFEGIDLLHIRIGSQWHTQVLGLQPLHQRILRLLGPAFCQIYFFSP